MKPDKQSCLETLRQIVQLVEGGAAEFDVFNVAVLTQGADDRRVMRIEVTERKFRDVMYSQDEGTNRDDARVVQVFDSSGRIARLSCEPFKDLIARLRNHLTCVRAQDLQVEAIKMSSSAWETLKMREAWIGNALNDDGAPTLLGDSIILTPDLVEPKYPPRDTDAALTDRRSKEARKAARDKRTSDAIRKPRQPGARELILD